MKKNKDEAVYSDYDEIYETNTDSGRRGGLQLIARIVCFLLAFAIWLYVVDNDADDYEKTFTLIPIDIDGAQILADVGNMSVINLEESAVSVTVRGKRKEVNALTSDDFRAYISVGGLTTAERHLLTVAVDLPEGVEKINVEPSAVNVYTDELSERNVEIEIVPRYIMDSSYLIGEVRKSIETVTVRGPKNVLDRIASVRAVLELGELTTGVTVVSGLEPVDKDGETVDDRYLHLAEHEVEVTIELYTNKTVPLVVSLSPAVSGETYLGADMSVDRVVLKGDPKRLADIDELVIMTLTSDEEKTYTVKLSETLLPDGVSFVSAPDTVNVTPVFAKPAPEVTTEQPDETRSPEDTANVTVPDVTSVGTPE